MASTLRPWSLALLLAILLAGASVLPAQVGMRHEPPPVPRGVAPSASFWPPSPASPERDPRLTIHAGARGQQPAEPWWQRLTSKPILESDNVLPIALEQLIIGSLEYSPRIRAISDGPLIRETAIVEADAEFDWAAFMESRWDDVSEPVGSELTTGRPGRFNDHRWDYRSGVRKKNRYGGDFEIFQQLGYQNNNSTFTIPNPQRTSRLALSYTHPLLRGGGRVYNTSLVVLAQIETGIANDEYSSDLQQELLDVATAYWGLYLERSSLLQRRRSYEDAIEIMENLEGRRGISPVLGEVKRAQAEVAARKSEVIRGETAVRNAESHLRMLVGDPSLGKVDEFELAPLDLPTSDYIPVGMEESLSTAFQNRPEIEEALKRIRASSVRANMSKNELLPVLDLVLESYVKGIRESDVFAALGDQWSKGAPTYAVGLEFEFPFRNRAARARHQRRMLEVRQLQQEFQATVLSLGREVEVAVHEVVTSYREMHARWDAMSKAEHYVDYLNRRWVELPQSDQDAIFLLEDLLTSQDRKTEEEFNFLSAQVRYNLSLIELKRALGTLLQHEQISTVRISDCPPALRPTKASAETLPRPDVLPESEAPAPVTPQGEPTAETALLHRLPAPPPYQR